MAQRQQLVQLIELGVSRQQWDQTILQDAEFAANEKNGHGVFL